MFFYLVGLLVAGIADWVGEFAEEDVFDGDGDFISLLGWALVFDKLFDEPEMIGDELEIFELRFDGEEFE